MIKFECHAKRPDGERLYRLIIDGQVVREGLTIDEVIEFINRSGEEDTRRGVRRRKKHGHDPV